VSPPTPCDQTLTNLYHCDQPMTNLIQPKYDTKRKDDYTHRQHVFYLTLLNRFMFFTK
jgi:hypothetical protein